MNTLIVSNIVCVLSIIGILITVLTLYRWVRAKSWLWFSLAWTYILFVRIWIMVKDWWVFVPQYSFTTVNLLMAFGYTFLFLGLLKIVWDLRRMIKNGYFKKNGSLDKHL